ncbi:MAG: hypothetical protein CM15mP117_25240 [Alphaproteobacteria bacterium]|nr:MAG: hypothetical protein CM15mP117_25240 [Alphaproteobacteria bacterium]
MAISEDYNQAMTSLKNRAFLVGGNAIAVLKLYEDQAFAGNLKYDVGQKKVHYQNKVFNSSPTFINALGFQIYN